jgi:acid phosphatase
MKLCLLACGTLLLNVTACGTVSTLPPPYHNTAASNIPTGIKKVVLVIFENEDSSKVEKTGYFQTLISQGAYFSQYYAVAHPSQPNYVALVSGSWVGISGDWPPKMQLDREHLGRLLGHAVPPLPWAVYAEDLDWSCEHGWFKNKFSKRFARKHVPFLNFDDVRRKGGPLCSTDDNDHIKDFEKFSAAANSDQLPSFSLVVPNLVHDGHSRSARCEKGQQLLCASVWLETHLKTFIDASMAPASPVVILVTFDESGEPWPYIERHANQVYTVALGAYVKPGLVSVPYNHYDLFRTIKAILKVDAPDDSANIITEIWRQP